jgi:hypothetical protein
MWAKGVAMLLTLALIVVAMSASRASAYDCEPEQLSPCLPAIVGGSAPTGDCCSNLNAQQGCFCQYANNPAYGQYINGPNARSALAACGIAVPSC